MLNNQLPEARVHEIIAEAVRIETEFVTEALPVDLIGMVSAQWGCVWCCWLLPTQNELARRAALSPSPPIP
jgi:hypothetical protein